MVSSMLRRVYGRGSGGYPSFGDGDLLRPARGGPGVGRIDLKVAGGDPATDSQEMNG